ncbi:NAD(P)-dependent oxidoreductase [Xanthobacteraceae bacterium A53D]
MKIAVVGASGNAGAAITAELARRGHQVTAIARNPEKIARLPGVAPAQGDAADQSALAALISGHDAVVTSIHFTQSDADVLIGAAKQAGVPRYLVVGGAGSLKVPPGVSLFDTPDFPAAYLPEAKAGGVFLEKLKAEPALDWTFLSPSALFFHGPRTETFRLGGDELLVAADGNSSISFEDYAIALADEIETPRHRRARFTVGY